MQDFPPQNNPEVHFCFLLELFNVELHSNLNVQVSKHY